MGSSGGDGDVRGAGAHPAKAITYDEWVAEARRRFGHDAMAWRFVCPACGHVASVRDWKDAGASDGEVAFSCVGLRTGAKSGGPCTYAGGGLFRLNPVTVEIAGELSRVFAFADPDPGEGAPRG